MIFADFTVDPGDPPKCERIWEHLTDAADMATPEGRVDLDAKIRAFIKTIEPRELREHYLGWIRQKRAEAYRIKP